MFRSACSRAPTTYRPDARRPRPRSLASDRGTRTHKGHTGYKGRKGKSVSLFEKPLERFPDDRRRDAVAPFVLAVGDVVAEVLEAWDEAAAGHIDWHDRIAEAVGDEDARLPVHFRRFHDAGEGRHDGA